MLMEEAKVRAETRPARPGVQPLRSHLAKWLWWLSSQECGTRRRGRFEGMYPVRDDE